MTFDMKKLEFDKIIELMREKAMTAMGKELITALVPLTDASKIEEALHETYEGTLFIKERIAPTFTGVYDIRDALKRARILGILSIENFIEIWRTNEATKRIKRELYRLKERLDEAVKLEIYANELVYFDQVSQEISNVLNDQGEVLSTASDLLKTIRNQLDTTERRIRQTLDGLLKSEAKKLTEAIITMRYNRYVIPVKISDKNSIKGTILDYSSSGETAFIEPDSIRELTSKKMRLEADEKKEIERLLYGLTVLVNSYYEGLNKNLMIIAHLDFVFAKAKYAYQTESIKPSISNTIKLFKARHPLINPSDVVSNSIIFDEDTKSMIITGSNTGGKTVTLKTLGLLSMMMQSGCLIPAANHSALPIFKQIRADIGDEQSIEQSLSTFSSHMKNIIRIVDDATTDALILLDELGSGTDPLEGSFLAMSILDYLMAQGATVLATTHYPELKAYAYTKKEIMNASVEFDEESLKPTYRLLLRTPGESHALLISERLGLKKSIIEAASKQALTNQNEITTLIKSLKDEGKRLDKLNLEYETLVQENETINKDLKILRKRLENDSLTIKDKLTKENQKVLASLKEEALALIKTLETMKETSFKAHELAELKYKTKQLVPELDQEKSSEERAYKTGDRVYIIPFNRYGELVKKQKNDQWLIKMGALNSVFKEEDFKYAEDQSVKEKKPQTTTTVKKKSVKGELDLRGLRVHEAEIELNKYLDDCALANMPFASIIHGFGTLALRKMVHDHLDKHPLVERYRDGEGGEGGQGVTIIYFK
jgi:DNA mismatch repair protein MutS2